MANKYHRKTVDRLKFDILLIMFIVAVLVIAVLVITKQIEARNTYISPLSAHHVNEIHVPVYVENTIYEDVETPEALIRQLWGSEADNALAVFKCESGLKGDAINKANTNGSIDYGFSQINSIHGIPSKWLLNWRTNITIAYQMWSEQGWRPWVCARKLGI
jgi:hypothetical protein